MTMHRAARMTVVVAAAALALAGCGSGGATPAATDGPTTPVATATTAAVAYTQSDVDGAVLPLDDLNLAGFHPFTFPDPAGGMPARSDDCLVRWQRTHRDQKESSTLNKSASYSQNDNVGPFVIQTVSVQPGAGAKDIIAAQKSFYAGACKTWRNPSSNTEYVAADETTLGSFGEQSYAYKVTATVGSTTVVLVGVMIRQGTLLSTIEYAASPSVNAARAKAVIEAAAKRLPSH
jgi:hypothetical protein